MITNKCWLSAAEEMEMKRRQLRPDGGKQNGKIASPPTNCATGKMAVEENRLISIKINFLFSIFSFFWKLSIFYLKFEVG